MNSPTDPPISHRSPEGRVVQSPLSDRVRDALAAIAERLLTQLMGITFVVRQDVLRVAQVWADHCTPVLTARYAEVDSDDLIGAMTGLASTAAASGKSPVDRPGAVRPEGGGNRVAH